MPKTGKQKKRGRSNFPGEKQKPTKEDNRRNNKSFVCNRTVYIFDIYKIIG